jgi:hypothetical protein
MLQPCPKCQNQNRPDAKFCAYCRTPLTVSEPQPATSPAALPAGGATCPQCGKVVNPRAKFCNYCGQVLVQVSVAAAVPPPGTVNTSASPPPPPYTPPAYTPTKQSLSRRQTTIIATSSVAVLAILVILIVVASNSLQASSTTSPQPTPTVTPSLTVMPQETKQPRSTSTPKPTQDVPSLGGPNSRRCLMPPPDKNAVKHFVKKDETIFGIVGSCEMSEKERREFLRWNQFDPNARPNELPFLYLDDCLWVTDSCAISLQY